MRRALEKFREKPLFIFSNFFSENNAIYETMWKNIIEADRPRMTILGSCFFMVDT
jgi:hypothetical protein